MELRARIGAGLALLLATVTTARAQEPEAQERTGEEPLHVLILTGANNHDWVWTSASLRSILDASGRFDVSVTFDPTTALADADALRRYAAFVLDYNGPRWGAEADANFLEAVRRGTGVAVVHAADNAFEGWQEYEELVGDLWRAGTGHGSFHTFDVDVIERDHPVTRGLPNLEVHPDELYHGLVRTPGTTNRVLATAFSDPAQGGTGRAEPMILVGSFGEGRVFHTPLGHVWPGHAASRVSHADPGFQELIVRGVEWAATGDVTERSRTANHLTLWERRAGWRLLFDGRSLAGWRAAGGDEPPGTGWSAADGQLRLAAGGEGGALVTRAEYAEFELEFEWRAAAAARGAVQYHLNQGRGSEFAIGGAATASDAGPVEPWQRGRIVARRDGTEHWRDGERIRDQHPAEEGFEPRPLPIALMNYGDALAFRSIRIRDLGRPMGNEVALFDGKSLDGWSVLGNGKFLVNQNSILGEAAGEQSFLVSDRRFADFILELEVRTIRAGNSGIQLRSSLDDEGRLVGYQIEIDPTERAWSGGLYYEGRAWVQDLAENEAGRAAFLHEEWNRFRIECVGPTIRAWVNGVPTTDYARAVDGEGVIALQLHAGQDTFVRWRGLRLWDLGG